MNIVVGRDGNLWFTEYGGNKIGRITPGGTFTEFAVPTPNACPKAIAAGQDANLWFTEWGGRKIGRMTPTGTVTEYSLDAVPEGIASGSDAVWFTEPDAGKIGRISL
jgi:virginiamycin B lyase